MNGALATVFAQFDQITFGLTEEQKAKERAILRATVCEDAARSISYPHRFRRGPYTVEIQSIEREDDIVSAFIRVFEGAMEIRLKHGRVRFVNPPLLVFDPLGSIDLTEPGGKLRRFREDPQAALLEIIGAEAERLAKDPAKPGEPTRLNTTTTVYAGTGDGYTGWTDAVAIKLYTTPGEAGSDTSTSDSALWLTWRLTSDYRSRQVGVAFDTSSISVSDTISSAIFSLNGRSLTGTINAVVGSYAFGTLDENDYRTPAQLQALTEEGTWASSGYNDEAYNDISLNTSAVVAGGTTSLWVWETRNESSTNPTGSDWVEFDSANATGTTIDPKLVVVHTATAITVSADTVGLSLGLLTPRLTINALVPTLGINLEGQTPAIAGGASIAVSPAEISFSFNVPDINTGFAGNAPVAEVLFGFPSPAIAGGAAVRPSQQDITIGPVAPHVAISSDAIDVPGTEVVFGFFTPTVSAMAPEALRYSVHKGAGISHTPRTRELGKKTGSEEVADPSNLMQYLKDRGQLND